MPVRETSIEAFQQIESFGLLSKRRFEVYRALFEHGPCTINELYAKVKVRESYNVQVNFHARMGELRHLGVVKEVRTRPCTVTGQRVIAPGDLAALEAGQ